MSFTIQYDLIIVGALTFLLGISVKHFLVSKGKQTSRLFPYALVFVPLAVVYAFIIDELPLRLFTIDPVYDASHSSQLGPQSISRDAIVGLIFYIASVVINLGGWLFSLIIVIRGLRRAGKADLNRGNSAHID